MNDQQRMKRVDRAQLRALFSVPFFAPGIAKLPVVFDDRWPTACTDGKKIMWNREWFDSLKDEVLVTVLCHEVAHPMLGHLWRFPSGADQTVWNIAADHAVNNMLKEFGESITAKAFANPFPMPDGPICCDPKYKDMAEEAIYADLIRNQPPGGGEGKRKGPQSVSAVSGQGPGGQSQPPGQGGGKSPPSGRPGAFGEFIPAQGNTPEQQAAQKQLETDWQATLMQSLAIAKGRGNVPGSLERFVDELLHPKVPWVDLLRNWLREKAEDDWNWMKPNQYFNDNEFILPSLDGERMGTVIFATDTSGSIDAEALAQFQSEKQACLDDMKPSKLIDIYCDSKIQGEQEYRVGDEISHKAPGGGGTSFVPVFERLEELPEKPKLVVYLTDLDGAFPDKQPDYPVLWVVHGGKTEVPFGDVVPIE